MDILQDYIINQEIAENEKSLKTKIFDYFYFMLNAKTYINASTLFILHILELMQLISFAFSKELILNWNISEKFNKYVLYILEGFRLVPILRLSSYNNFLIVFFVIFAVIMILFICLILQILYFKKNSKFSSKLLSITKLIIPFLTIFLFLPISELFLVPFKCNDNEMFAQNVKCWKGIHFSIAILGIIGEISFLCFIYVLNFFYFYPFNVGENTIKINPEVDLLLIRIKFIYELQYIFIKDDDVSIPILLILSLYLLFNNIKKRIYFKQGLEILVNLRNILVFWTFLMLLIARLCSKTNFNNNIILLLLSFPIIIYGFIIFYLRSQDELEIFSSNNNENIDICLRKIKTWESLVSSFIAENKSNIKNFGSFNSKKEIMLNGLIKMHTKTCLKEDCPLTKFINNEQNYITQKQCLLNYMTIYFNNALRKFPNDILIRMHYIQFNYDHKYNLSSVKTTFEEIKNIKFKFQYHFILYCQEKHITRMQLNEANDGDEEEKEKLILEQNYRKLKNLISNATKLYAEFWGIFATHITNSLNTSKLYKLGEKLNKYLKEIHYLWKNELRNKKINFENQNVAQLFSRFLREILWDQKKSEAVQKKINEEKYLQEFDKIKDDNKFNINNIGNLENQDFLIFVSSNEKGKCNIIQFSNSLCFIIGYQKHELINMPLETLMPSMFIEGHSKKVENFIKSTNNIKNEANENFSDSIAKRTFILIKNKMGYLIPFNSYFTLYDDNDFSNSFIIKARLESIDTKSMYPYYLLANPDFSLDSFSSSAIHLGFSMDLLKKYVIKLNILIRTGKDEPFNLNEKYKLFENHEKIITWVFPDLIYPKDEINMEKNKIRDKKIQELINISKKQKFNLQITEMKYKENEIIGFVFKLFDVKNRKEKNKELLKKKFIPNNNTQIIFDLLNLNYIRTVIVKKKSGYNNLRRNDEEEKENINNKKDNNNKKRIREKEELKEKEDSSDDEQIGVQITKEKIFELQTKDSSGIKSFINILQFYGNDISLVKHRPNREQYHAGKAQEPSIKINLSNFTKRIEARIKNNPNFFKKLKEVPKDEKLSENVGNSKRDEQINNNDLQKTENQKERIEVDIDKEFSGNSQYSLENVINVNSLKIIKYIDFLIYVFSISILIIEFILTYLFFEDHIERYTYFKYSYKMLNDLTYIKYYVTEGILITELNYYFVMEFQSKDTYLDRVKNDIKSYLYDVNEILSKFNTPRVKFSKEYNEYVSNTIILIKTLSNNKPTTERHPFISAETKLTNALYQISSSRKEINFNDKYVYELMINLLDSYYINYEQLIRIMVNDFNQNTNNCGVKNIVIFSVCLFISIVYLIIFYKLIQKLEIDREKSINLFLTIKNSVFEDLKNTAENFSNKLLNKFFGVDENEEESQKDFQTIIKPKDINIAKFKGLNELGISSNKGTSFMFYFIQLALFYGVIIIIMLLKYLNTIFYYRNIKGFIKIYNMTYFSEIYMVSTIDIMKQYFYNVSIVNYGFTEDTQIYNFLIGFERISDHIAYAIEETFCTQCFLKDNYVNSFRKYYYGNFSELINAKEPGIIAYTSVGFKMINSELTEELRFLYISYFINNRTNINNLNASDLINDFRWITIDNILYSFLEPWYTKMIELLDQQFYDYANGKQSSNLLLFILIIIANNIYYWIIWKKYEDDFIKSIERSFELINLIPEEIKSVIAEKLNESS